MKDNLNVWEKIQKNILLFQYQLKKNLTMENQLHSFRFLSSSLSNIVDKLSEGFDYMSVKDEQLIFVF